MSEEIMNIGSAEGDQVLELDINEDMANPRLMIVNAVTPYCTMAVSSE